MQRFLSPKPESHPVMKTTFFLTSTFLPDQGGILLTIQDNRATKIPARVFDSAAAAAERLLFRSCCSISGSFHQRRRRRRRRQNRSLPRSSLPLLESVGWNFGKKYSSSNGIPLPLSAPALSSADSGGSGDGGKMMESRYGIRQTAVYQVPKFTQKLKKPRN